LNILHISSAKSWRGGERQVHYLIRGQASKENEVYLMCPARSPLKSKCIADIKDFVPIKKGAAGYPMNLITLVKLCKEVKIDIIHGHDSHSHSLIWMAYKIGTLKTPSVVTRRLNNPIRDKSKAKYNHPGVQKIICVSTAVKEKMMPQIVDCSRLEIIHSAIDLSDISEPKRISIDQEFTIGYVAAFTEEKDHQLFMEVALELLKRSNQYRFLLVGDGPLLEQTKNLAGDLINKFEFTGFVDGVNSEYKKMDLLLHTAKAEALGTSILDGMKFGLPIVANDVGGIKEIVKQGKNGLLTERRDFLQMSDNVHSILSDTVVYNSMSAMSLELIRPFGISAMLDKTIGLYKKILDL